MENKYLVISFNPENRRVYWDLILAENTLKANEWIKKVRHTEVAAVFGALFLLDSAQFLIESPVDDIRIHMKEFERSVIASTEFPTAPNQTHTLIQKC